jgi:hypothetical protein
MKLPSIQGNCLNIGLTTHGRSHLACADAPFQCCDVIVCLKMIAVPSGPGKDFEVPVEIIIGTVPLRKVQDATATGAMLLTVDSAMNQKRSRPQQDVNVTG